MQFDYFYGNEAEQYVFYRIPKLLITSSAFKKVSDGAKLLYGLMLDRLSLSVKNGWVDEDNRAYIFFTTSDVMEQMNCGTEKATRMLAELDGDKGIGLIERKKQGQGKPAMVYLKKFFNDEGNKQKFRLSETESQDFGKSKVKTFENRNSRVSETESAEFRLPKCNYTDISNTDKNNNVISYHIGDTEDNSISPEEHLDPMRWIEERERYKELIKENIEYDILSERFDKGWLDEIVELMTDVVCSKQPYIRINKQDYPHEAVKSRFLKIGSSQIEYIYLSLNENCSNVRNIRAFLITTIYRSFETSNNWFAAKVNYDLGKENGADVAADV